MTNSKITRKALLTSIVALMLCFAMLTGTTFAWFTDTATSGNNKIIAGNLDVQLLMYNDVENKYENIGDSDKPIFGEGSLAQNDNAETLWEPGKTQVAYLAVNNAGNLALKYNIFVDVTDNGLVGALEYAIIPVKAGVVDLAGLTWADVEAMDGVEVGDVPAGRIIAAKNGCLDEMDADENADYFALAIHMKEEAGNEYKSTATDKKSVTIDITVVATQVGAEEDSFGTDYDDPAPIRPGDTIIARGTKAESGDTTLADDAGKISATIPSGAALEDGVTEIELIMFRTETHAGTFSAETGENLIASYDIDIPAVLDTNTAPITVVLSGILPAGIDVVNLYHNGQAMDPADYEYDSVTGKLTIKTASFSTFDVAFTVPIDTWDSEADTSWYNDTDTEFVLTTAEAIVGLAKLVDGGNTFEGKTIKLQSNIDLYKKGENGEAVCFNPIGSYRSETAFKGTFDGQGYTISNLSQNTWALENGYYYSDLGLGFFGLVEDATIKNVNFDGASISGESAICGTVAATAYGDCIFENITVTNSDVADYQYYAGGIVGWASGDHQYININVDESTVIGSQWGDFGNASGGVIGGMGSSAAIYMKDCTVACRIDAVNDVVSAYQWYNYRNCGMLVGRVPQTITNGEVQTVATPNVTCENVTVIYGDWANYTYCEFAGTGYPYVRVQAGTSVGAYSNVRYGHPTDANGNVVTDDNHVHNEGEAHFELIAFDQLYGGPANHRYCYYGIAAHDGVTVVYNNK